ncbi:hypothetical protein [Phaffia rhodozyma]|uniref:Uncharacterized protein n=1 Tax=Phaffia rhodozyma TaxID=264483 RepID=A0A0F7STC4_PHARH|nr:hypothetical protein [Phaffia rhodozyma]
MKSRVQDGDESSRLPFSLSFGPVDRSIDEIQTDETGYDETVLFTSSRRVRSSCSRPFSRPRPQSRSRVYINERETSRTGPSSYGVFPPSSSLWLLHSRPGENNGGGGRVERKERDIERAYVIPCLRRGPWFLHRTDE